MHFRSGAARLNGRLASLLASGIRHDHHREPSSLALRLHQVYNS
jgi:hypothetical protein